MSVNLYSIDSYSEISLLPRERCGISDCLERVQEAWNRFCQWSIAMFRRVDAFLFPRRLDLVGWQASQNEERKKGEQNAEHLRSAERSKFLQEEKLRYQKEHQTLVALVEGRQEEDSVFKDCTDFIEETSPNLEEQITAQLLSIVSKFSLSSFLGRVDVGAEQNIQIWPAVSRAVGIFQSGYALYKEVKEHPRRCQITAGALVLGGSTVMCYSVPLATAMLGLVSVGGVRGWATPLSLRDQTIPMISVSLGTIGASAAVYAVGSVTFPVVNSVALSILQGSGAVLASSGGVILCTVGALGVGALGAWHWWRGR